MASFRSRVLGVIAAAIAALSVTVFPQSSEDDAPDALVIPVGSIRRIELRTTAQEHVGFGFSLPSA